MKNVRRVVVLGGLLAGIASTILLMVECSKPDPKASKFGFRAAEVFHQQFNDLRESDFSNDWIDHGHEVIRTPSGSFEFAGYLHGTYVQNTRTRLGRLKNASLKSCDTSLSKVGIFVHLTFDDQFDHGAATEKITFLVNPDTDPDSAALTSYIIESPLLQGQTGF